MDLEGKVAIVTGAAGPGVGSTTARTLARDGASVVVADRRHRTMPVAEELRGIYGQDRVLGVHCDITIPEDVEAMVQKTLEEFGRIDILVNNAGWRNLVPITEMTNDQWKTVVDINLNGCFFTTRAVLPSMIKQQGGRIINISSAAAYLAFEDEAHYEAAKAGLLGLTRATAKEMGKHNILVNALILGTIVHRESFITTPEELYKPALKGPLGRYGKPEEVAEVVAFLASERASYVSGSTIAVTGGYYMY